MSEMFLFLLLNKHSLFLGTDSHTTSDGVFGQFPTGVGNTDATFILELLHFIKKIEVLLVYKYNIHACYVLLNDRYISYTGLWIKTTSLIDLYK
jgi:hypothetical protein